jgi:hypothetical protein
MKVRAPGKARLQQEVRQLLEQGLEIDGVAVAGDEPGIRVRGHLATYHRTTVGERVRGAGGPAFGRARCRRPDEAREVRGRVIEFAPSWRWLE